MVLVRFGWIHTKFCSFALALLHQLQQRKLILAKNEEQKKSNQNTESPKTTRQDSPEKQQNKKKTQKRQTKSIKTWSLTSVDYFVFS